ncbi:MAG: response regulator [Acidobacteriota bacterium]
MKSLHILLIEDNQDHAFLTQKILRQSENVASVRVLNDGEEALAYLERTERSDDPSAELPDLVLLDLKLLKADGFEVLTRIKASPELSWVPVVLLTTSARDEEIAKGYRLGANSYVTKPIQFDEFARKIRRIEEYWSRVSELPSRAHVEKNDVSSA